MEQIADSGVAEEVLKDLGCFIANYSAELGVESGHGAILSRAPTFGSIEAMVRE